MTIRDRRRKVPKRARQLGTHVPLACQSGKRSWLDRQDAVRAARLVDGRFGTGHRVYRCRDCRQYHLTTGAKQ